MNERVCQFGPGGRLSAILTQPRGTARKVGCILVSAGLVPKFGPYRLYTQLARRLAQLGVTTLRFDLGGIGDSVQDQSNLPRRARTAQEIRAAVDYLVGQRVVDSIVVGGLCSGAEDSFLYAEEDSRVSGVVMIDPFSYRTSGWFWRHMLHRLTRRVLRAVGVYVPSGFGSTVDTSLGRGVGVVQYKYIEREESRRILSTLIGRKVHSHFVYTGGASETFNHPGQMPKMFPGLDFEDCVSVSYLPQMEHTQLLEEDRLAVVDAISQWFTRHYPVTARDSTVLKVLPDAGQQPIGTLTIHPGGAGNTLAQQRPGVGPGA